MRKYKAVVNEQYEFIDPDPNELDVIPNGHNRFHVLHQGKSYQAEIRSLDWESRVLQLHVNGQNFSVRLEDKYDQLISQLGLNVAKEQHIKDVKAPMPGLVLKIKARTGQEVAAGDILLILEAMKMENVIKATTNGTVKSIPVKAGDPVEKGQLLVEME